jgi:hypothetical protein
VYQQLKSRVASLLARPIPMKPQTERQLAHHLAEHSSDIKSFLLCAAAVLEEYELDIAFGPLFTPTLDDRAEIADLLFHWRPTAEQLNQLVVDLCAEIPHAVVRLLDGTEAKLTLHEVMVERFVRLLRLEHGPDPATAAALREVLPADLWSLGVALLCERGMGPAQQAWFVSLVSHMALRHGLSRGALETAAEFVAGQPKLDRAAVVAAAAALLRATEGTAAYAAGGHAYWSPDVAQHHHYRGQGRIDEHELARRRDEVARVTALVEDLRTFDPGEAAAAKE